MTMLLGPVNPMNVLNFIVQHASIWPQGVAPDVIGPNPPRTAQFGVRCPEVRQRYEM